MPSHKQLIVEVPASTRANGRADTESLQKAYPQSPIHNGELNDEVVEEQFIALVQEGIVNDGGHTFGEFDRDYTDAPNFEDVETGGGGLPGAPYAPNVASPAQPGDPTSIPEVGAEVTKNARGGGDPFPGDGLASPSTTSKNVSAQTVRIGSLQSGTSTPGGGS